MLFKGLRVILCWENGAFFAIIRIDTGFLASRINVGANRLAVQTRKMGKPAANLGKSN